MTDVRARLAQCFAADTVAAWDSVANMTLLAVVEEEFGLSVFADDLERLDSFDALLAYFAAPPVAV